MTQLQLAGYLGIGRSNLAMIETGRAPIHAELLAGLGSQLGVDVLFVLTGKSSAVVAGDLLDWALVEKVLQALGPACATIGISMTPPVTAKAIRVLYRFAALQGEIRADQILDVLRLGLRSHD